MIFLILMPSSKTHRETDQLTKSPGDNDINARFTSPFTFLKDARAYFKVTEFVCRKRGFCVGDAPRASTTLPSFADLK